LRGGEHQPRGRDENRRADRPRPLRSFHSPPPFSRVPFPLVAAILLMSFEAEPRRCRGTLYLKGLPPRNDAWPYRDPRLDSRERGTCSTPSADREPGERLDLRARGRPERADLVEREPARFERVVRGLAFACLPAAVDRNQHEVVA